MPNYKLTATAWADREAAKIRYILQEKMEKNREYSTEDILALLRHEGLFYTNPEYVPIGIILIAEGLIEAV